MNIPELHEQLTGLVATCGGVLRSYTDMFYSDIPRDITLQMLGDDLEVTEITVPNRAKIIADSQGAVADAIIRENQTVCVSPAGNDATGNGTGAAPYASIGAAWGAVRRKRIAPDVSVNIQLADGRYPLSSGVYINHPDGDRITISGKNTYTTTLSTVSVNGATAAITVANAEHILQGDMLIISGPSGGTNPEVLGGAYSVTAVSGDLVTVKWPEDAEVIPDGAVSATVTVLKAIVEIAEGANCRAAFIAANSIHYTHFGVRADQTDITGLYAFICNNGKIEFDTVGVSSIYSGVWCYSGKTHVAITNSGISDLAHTGIGIGVGVSVDITNTYISRVPAIGVLCSKGSFMQIFDSMITGAAKGCISDSNAMIYFGNSVSKHNVLGFFSNRMSTIQIEPTCVVSDNGTDFSPTPGTTGNYNSIIIDLRS